MKQKFNELYKYLISNGLSSYGERLFKLASDIHDNYEEADTEEIMEDPISRAHYAQRSKLGGKITKDLLIAMNKICKTHGRYLIPSSVVWHDDIKAWIGDSEHPDWPGEYETVEAWEVLPNYSAPQYVFEVGNTGIFIYGEI